MRERIDIVHPSHETAVMRYESSPAAYHFLFMRGEDAYFWNAILGIRKAGGWFDAERNEV